MESLKTIVEGGYCIGCGACSARTSGLLEIKDNRFRKYEPVNIDHLQKNEEDNALMVCPFSNSGPNEDEIAEKLFKNSDFKQTEVVGFYKSLYAGHVTNLDLRKNVTSGGIITWTLQKLLEKGYVDAVIHVKRSSRSGVIFEYGISKTNEEIALGGKSRYYPIEMSEVLERVKNENIKYAFVGLPCFVKAIRKYSEVDTDVAQRIKFTVGLVCGHLKSKAFAEYVSWQGGIDPERLNYIDFRHKLEDRPADNYGIKLEEDSGKSKVLVAKEVKGTNWGLGYFKYEACDYCDDIFSETADLCVGDAWLKNYTSDSYGNSVVVSRNLIIDKLLEEGNHSGEVKLDVLTADEMRMSQGGGFRHRRVSLAYRLYLKKKKGEWFPNKRVQASPNTISFPLKLISHFRTYIMIKSAVHWADASESKNYKDFELKMYMPGLIYKKLLDVMAIIKRYKK